MHFLIKKKNKNQKTVGTSFAQPAESTATLIKALVFNYPDQNKCAGDEVIFYPRHSFLYANSIKTYLCTYIFSDLYLVKFAVIHTELKFHSKIQKWNTSQIQDIKLCLHNNASCCICAAFSAPCYSICNELNGAMRAAQQKMTMQE